MITEETAYVESPPIDLPAILARIALALVIVLILLNLALSAYSLWLDVRPAGSPKYGRISAGRELFVICIGVIWNV